MKDKLVVTLSAILGGILAVLLLVHANPRYQFAQARNSNNAQTRLAAVNLTAGQVVGSADCPAISTVEQCVAPATGTALVAGVVSSENGCLAGQPCEVMMTGVALCKFDNTPVKAQLALHNNDQCDSQAGSLLTNQIGTGIIGFISALYPPDSTRAWVTMYRPGATGYLVPLTYIVATGTMNSTTCLYGDSTWKTCGTGGTVTAVTGTSPIVSSGGTTPAISCPTCSIYPTLIATQTITGTTTVGLLASVQTVTVAVTGVVAGGSYSVIPTAAPTSGFGVLSGAFGAGTNSLTIFIYQPSVVLGASYSIPVKVFRIG